MDLDDDLLRERIFWAILNGDPDNPKTAPSVEHIASELGINTSAVRRLAWDLLDHGAIEPCGAYEDALAWLGPRGL